MSDQSLEPTKTDATGPFAAPAAPSPIAQEPIDPAAPPTIDPPSLQDSMRRLRLGTVERSDVLAELRETERVRLEILNDNLEEMRAEIPEGVELFTFELGGGDTPRLWIDATSHVHMGRDRRTYRFVKDTRLGRNTLCESADVLVVANTITDYVAERILDREQALEADWMRARARTQAPAATPASLVATTPTPTDTPEPGSRDAVLAEVADLATRLAAPVEDLPATVAPNAAHPQAAGLTTLLRATAAQPLQAPAARRENAFWFGLFMFVLGAAVSATALIAYAVKTGVLAP